MLNEGFIICDNNTKEMILRENTTFKNYIFLTFKELKEKLLGSYKPEAKIYLHDKFNLSYDLIDEDLKYIEYVSENTYKSNKLKNILLEKQELINNGLYSKDEFFLYRLKQFPVTFINPVYDNEFLIIKNIVLKYTTVYINDNKNEYELNEVFEYNTLLDELLDTFNKIKLLIENKVDYQNIYIVNTSSDYNYLLKRLAISYNIPLNMNSDKNILRLDIAKKFIELSKEDLNYSTIFENLDNKSEYYLPILNIVNKYNLGLKSSKKYLDFMIREMKNMPYQGKKYIQMVNVKPKASYSDNDYVFYLNFNLGKVPKIVLDEKYLNDLELKELGLNTSYELNDINKKKLISDLKAIKNLTISYPKEINGKEVLPSLLVNELALKPKQMVPEYGYSNIEDVLRLAAEYNKYVKFNSISNDLKKYDISGLKYGSYDNKYKGINKELLDDFYQEKKLDLSYSTMKKYYACPFSYFAARVLGLDEFEETLATNVGKYGHQVLEDSYKADFDFYKSIAENKKMAKSYKELFYFEKMDGILAPLIDFNKSHDELSKLKTVKCEELVEFDKENYHFKGYIDKLYYLIDGNECYAVIVDYKTGSDEMSLDNFEDGFNMQLPVYMLMLKKYPPFIDKNIHIVGIYLQKVNIVKLNKNEDSYKQLCENFKLKGYSINDRSYLSLFDNNYQNSDYIKGMKLSSSGDFYKYTKVFNSKDQEYIINKISDMIDFCANGIRNGEFKIAPKRLAGTSQSCTFCTYKDLCNKTFADFVDIEKKPYKGSEENGVD